MTKEKISKIISKEEQVIRDKMELEELRQEISELKSEMQLLLNRIYELSDDEEEKIEKVESFKIPNDNAIYFSGKSNGKLEMEASGDNKKFAIFNINNNTADFAYVGQPINPDYFDSNLFEFLNNPDEINIQSIETIEPGKAVKEESGWKMTSPATIRFNGEKK